MIRESHLIRHTEKVGSKKTPEEVTPDEIKEIRKKVIETNPGVTLDDQSLRHLVLREQDAAVFGQEEGKKSTITFAGIVRAQAEASQFAKGIDQMPDKSVVILGPGSPKDRCQETQDIYEQELKVAAGKKDGLQIIEDQGLVPEGELDQQGAEKVVIINHDSPEGIEASQVGPWGPKYLSELKKGLNKEVGDKETPAVLVWAARKEEVEGLQAEFQAKGIMGADQAKAVNPSKFETKENTPETIAKEIITYLRDVMKQIQEKYPERSVYFQSISHNMILDVATLRLLGERISRESLKELSDKEDGDYEASRPLEGRTVKFEGDKLLISFRGKEKEWTLDQLEELIKDEGILDQEAEERVKEWQS